jgi:hypothetical protein
LDDEVNCTDGTNTCTAEKFKESLLDPKKCPIDVDIVVELSSSKSRIFKITSNYSTKDVTVTKGNKVKTMVDTDGDGKDDIEKGLGGACNTKGDQKWSDDVKCQKHIDDITAELKKLVSQGYVFSSLRFLATAGLRQSKQKVDTFVLLKKTIERETWPIAKNEIEYRPLSGEEEAENEFLATMMLLRTSNIVNATQPLGIMGFGGGSLQYGMLTPTQAKQDQDKQIQIESAKGGLDKVFVEVTREADACKIEYGSDGEKSESGYTTSEEKYTECKTEISGKFSVPNMFRKSALVKEHWALKNLPLYVTGGITYAIYDHFSKHDDKVKTDENGKIKTDENGKRTLTVWDYNLTQLKEAAITSCTPYVRNPIKQDKHAKQLCTKYAYLVLVLKQFGIPADKKIRFRQQIPAVVGGKQAQWIRSAVMKQKFSDNPMLQPFDTQTITKAAVLEWENDQRVDAETKKAAASALASERLI